LKFLGRGVFRSRDQLSFTQVVEFESLPIHFICYWQAPLLAQKKLVRAVTRGKVAPGAFYFLAARQLVRIPVGAGLVYAGLKYGAASLAFYREIAGQCPEKDMRCL